MRSWSSINLFSCYSVEKTRFRVISFYWPVETLQVSFTVERNCTEYFLRVEALLEILSHLHNVLAKASRNMSQLQHPRQLKLGHSKSVPSAVALGPSEFDKLPETLIKYWVGLEYLMFLKNGSFQDTRLILLFLATESTNKDDRRLLVKF